MADDNYDEFDELDNFDDMEFDDVDNDEPGSDRIGITSTFNGASTHFMDDFKDTAVLKQVGAVADSAFQALAGKKVSKNYNAVKDTLNKELSNSVKEIKLTAKPFVEKLKESLPEDSAIGNVLDKLETFLGGSRGRVEESPEERVQRESNELLATVFGEESKRNVLDQTIVALSSKGRDDLLRQIAAINQTTLEFHNSNTINYYKKSIELKYKHLFETKRMFALQVKSFETFKRQFETIVKNTGLPEFVKIRGLEALQANMRERAFGSAYESISNGNNWVSNAKDNITNRIRSTTQGVTDALTAGTEGLDMATDLGDQFSDASQRNMIIGSMGADGTRTASGRILGKVLGKTKRGKKFHEWINKVNADPSGYFSKMADDSDGIKSKIAGGIANIVSMDDNYQPYKDLTRESLDAATFLDNRTKKSINTVIPALLSKIYGVVDSIRTGKSPDGLSFDFTKDTLVKDSEIKDILIGEFGKKTTKEHAVKIESFVTKLVAAAGMKFTNDEMILLSARITTFGIKDKNLTLGRLEEVGFFRGLDTRTEIMYRSIFDNLGKDNNGVIDHNVRAILNKDLGEAVNIRSNPDKIIKEAIDNGYTEKLVELGILKWDEVKSEYVIDLAKFDMHTIKGINDSLFKEEESYVTIDDAASDKVRDAVLKGKKKVTDNMLKIVDKYIDPLMDKVVEFEEAYDDNENRHTIKRIKDVIVAGKKAALEGDDVDDAKKTLDKLNKDVSNMLNGQVDAVSKGKKSKWEAFKDSGKVFYKKLANSGLKDALIEDISGVGSRVKNVGQTVNDKVVEDFDINVLAKLDSGKNYMLKYLEIKIVKRYSLDIENDIKVIKDVREIIVDNLMGLDGAGITSLTMTDLQDIYDNIVNDVEDAGLHLVGVNVKRNTNEIKDNEYNVIDEHINSTPPVQNIKSTEELQEVDEVSEDVRGSTWIKELRTSYDNVIKSINKPKGDERSDARRTYDTIGDLPNKKETWREEYGYKISNEVQEIKLDAPPYEKKSVKDSKEDAQENTWLERLNISISKLTDSIAIPKFDKNDKDKDGDRDGGFADRKDFFKRTKGKAADKAKDVEDKKSGKGMFGIIAGLFGATLFAPIKFMASVLGGLPNAFGGILSALGVLSKSFGLVGTMIKWGFSSIMGIMRLGMGLGKGIGKVDKWLGPKLRKILSPKNIFSKKGLLVAGGALLANHNWDYIKDGASNVIDGANDIWKDVYPAETKADLSTPTIMNATEDAATTSSLTPPLIPKITPKAKTPLKPKPFGKDVKKIVDIKNTVKPKIPVNDGKTTKLALKATKLAGKSVSKLIPFVSTPIYAYEAKTRYDDGNYIGAAASAVAIPLSYVPWVGGIGGMAITMATETEEEAINNDVKSIASNDVEKVKRPALKVSNTKGMSKMLLDRIAKGEVNTMAVSGYNVTLGFGKYLPKNIKPLYTMTINEVYELQNTMLNNGASSTAVGRYQFLQMTLKELVKASKIDPATTIFGPNVQDALILIRLNGLRGFAKWRKGVIDDDLFILKLSQEFASIACSIDTQYKGKPVKRGNSFYGQGVHTTLKEMYATLNSMRKAGGGVVIDREEIVSNGKHTPNTKKSGGVEGVIKDSVDELLKFLGVRKNKDASFTESTEPGDGTPVETDNKGDASAVSSSYKPGGDVSKVNGNAVKGSQDSSKQLCSLQYKHVRFPNIIGPTIVPKYIVIHNTAGSSLYLGRMKSSGIGTALWIDTNGEVILVNKLTNRTWHVGAIKNLKGGSKQKVRSANSIGIEMVCAYNKNAKKWHRYTEKQKLSLRRVVACLMGQFSIPKSNVVAHIQVAYKTEGEGSEGLEVINGVSSIDVPANSGEVPNIDYNVTASTDTLKIDIPAITTDLGDGTPVYKNTDKQTQEAITNNKGNVGKIVDKPNVRDINEDMNVTKLIKDLDVSLGNAITPSLMEMTKELKLNNEYQRSISEDLKTGNNYELTIKDEKGKVLPKATVAPTKMEFDRALL